MKRVKRHTRTIERQTDTRQGYRVLYRNTMYPLGYVGMNYYAAKELKIPFHHGKKTVVVWTGLNKKDRELTIDHEINEARVMSMLGLRYCKAHRVAQGLEDMEAHLI